MSIATKKITDLAELSNISGDNTYFLGMSGGTTGKISYGRILSEVNDIINNTVQGATAAAIAQSASLLSNNEDDETEESLRILTNDVETLRTQLSDTVKAYKELQNKYESHVASSAQTILTLQGDISALANKVAAFEGFLYELQRDDYLTLKEIQKAAYVASPLPVEEQAQTTGE